ncbi:APC family permease [Streptomyces sp. NBS 14/10]|nr:APC family permease [Streptomyces sp. NBS 14/10]KAK1186426.1 APC family permease [Streptomyces sp. NBS 14/10]
MPAHDQSPEASARGFRRSIGLFPAVAINMTQMCGIGPFITIPAMIAAMNGPQAIFGWVVGAALAMADGLIWAELGAAMPGAGGTYVYLREAFQYRSGRLMPFLFVWTAILAIPLTLSTGLIGFVQYLGYFLPNLSWLHMHVLAVLLGVAVIFAIYRKVDSVKRITMVLWIVMLLAVAFTIGASFTDFHANLAFEYPPGAFGFTSFFSGLGSGLIIAVYDYLGYNTTAYMGEELKEPGRVIPRSIIIAILGMMAIYLPMNLGVIGTVPWKEAEHSNSVATLVVTQNWGHTAAGIVTVLILIAAFASIAMGLLGGCRVPYNAAQDGVFFKFFGRLHPKHGFPHVALLIMGAIMIFCSFFDFTTAISMLVSVTILIQALAQVAAVSILRRRQPGLKRPYKQWLYPVPSILALIGWVYVYSSVDRFSIYMSIAWVIGGIAFFAIWASVTRIWPFGPREIREAYLDTQSSSSPPMK